MMRSTTSSADLRRDRSEPFEDRLRRRPAASHVRFALELVADEVGIEIEEGHLLELVVAGIFEELPERCARDRPATEARDDGISLEYDARERLAHAVGYDPAQTDREALFEHDDALGILQRVAHRRQREGAEGAERDRADLHAVVAHLVDDLLDGAVD